MSNEKNASESIADTELNAFAGLTLILKSQPLIFITLFVSLLFGFYSYFIHSVDKPYILSLGLFDVKWLGLFVSVVYITQALVIFQFEMIKKRLGEFQLMTLSWVIFSIGMLGMYKFFGVLGLVSALVFYSSEPFREAIINSFSQRHIPKKIRATTLSSIKVYQGFFAAILGFAAGLVFDKFGIRSGMLMAFIYSISVFAFIYFYKSIFKIKLE